MRFAFDISCGQFRPENGLSIRNHMWYILIIFDELIPIIDKV